MILKLTKEEMSLILHHISPHVKQDPAKLDNKDAIWIYILMEIAKKLLNAMPEFTFEPRKKVKIKLKTYQIRAFKELLDLLDLFEIGENDPWQYAVLISFYDHFPTDIKLIG